MTALELAIVAWLDAKGNRSKSIKTWTAYRDNLSSFRAALQSNGVDLDGDPRAVALAAQGWAGHSVKDRDVSPATYKQRVACVASFYTYARKQGIFERENPIGRVERRRVQGYAHASAIDVTELKDRLKAIPRETVEGKRDYALLNVALNTGRRLSELAGLRWCDVQITGDRALVTWQRAKGGKVMSDKLPAPVTRALVEYLRAAYGPQMGRLGAEAPVGASL